MTPTIEFIFDFASPNAYFAYRVLPPILERSGARVDIIPCLLGGIFKATGNKAPFVAFAPIKGKLEYEMLEIKRFVARHKLDRFRMNPHFPVNSLMLMRGYIAAQGAGVGPAFLEMGLRGLWEDGLKLDDPEVRRARSTRPASTRRICSPRRKAIRSSRRSPTIPRPRSRAACSVFRPSSWGTRCSSARSGSGKSRRRSRRSNLRRDGGLWVISPAMQTPRRAPRFRATQSPRERRAARRSRPQARRIRALSSEAACTGLRAG